MSQKVEEFIYQFVDIVLVGHRPHGRFTTTWYVQCEECGERHQFHQTGKKQWHTSCAKSKVEWTITPAEYYICKPADFSKILGGI